MNPCDNREPTQLNRAWAGQCDKPSPKRQETQFNSLLFATEKRTEAILERITQLRDHLSGFMSCDRPPMPPVSITGSRPTLCTTPAFEPFDRIISKLESCENILGELKENLSL